ncbi:hypothetical protein Fuma_04088 [Fuerstiella marisgermanici]|uniref:Uncharacterized protein n=1 Tax=Fuerstiella marisgermanici TaxID=1891926 RepID=A0A1P8WK93_9PLAN|nr:hypothetical protein Fuma_04088 [Fuerstiella marisgermanici]
MQGSVPEKVSGKARAASGTKPRGWHLAAREFQGQFRMAGQRRGGAVAAGWSMVSASSSGVHPRCVENDA